MFHLRGVRTLVRHRRASAAIFSVALFCAIWTSTRRPTAQNQTPRGPGAAERIDAVAPARPLNPSDRGATYRWLEERAVRVTTTFVDAVAVTERIPGGDLRTRLTDSGGRELGEFAVDRVAAGNDELSFRRGGEQVVRAAGKPDGRLTLDWSNEQAYAMWKDKANDSAVALEWQGDVIRARGSRPIDFRGSTLDIRTEWLDGFTAKSTRSVGRRPHPTTGANSRGSSLESRLTRDNLEVGRSRWYPEEQVYVWSVPGLSSGYLDTERLNDVGGWTFTPDLAWANVQTYAFHYFHTLVATQGFVAGARPAPRPWLERLVQAVAPTVHANEPGCDGFHWLDNTIFRPCCDAHDRCYEKNGCTWKSWWQWWSGWTCNLCNLGVAICISSMYPPFSPAYP
jgi:hypothetical protein